MQRNFENTDITVIDLESLAVGFSAEIGQPVEIRSFSGLIREPKLGLLDRREIVLQETEDGTFTLHLQKKTDPRRITLSVAEWAVKVSVADLEPHLVETMPIAQFIGEMRGFGNRRMNNEVEVTEWLNEA